MARHFTKYARLAAAIGMSLFGIGVACAAEVLADGSMSAKVNPQNSSLEFTTRSYRPRVTAPVGGGVKLTSQQTVVQDAPLPDDQPADADPQQTRVGHEMQADFMEPATEPVAVSDEAATLANCLTPLDDSAGKLGYDTKCDASCASAALGPCATCGKTGTNCCCCCCGPRGRFWVRDEYLGFWGKSDHLPALVNTGVVSSAPSTTTLFGDQNVNNGFRSGNWVQAGAWLDSCQTIGIMGDYLFVGRQTTNFYDSTAGTAMLTRPFTNALTGLPGAELISYPGLLKGNVSVNDNNNFGGAGVAGMHQLLCCQGCQSPCADACYQNCCRLDAIGGFRWYQYRDNLSITENLTTTSGSQGVPTGTTLAINDTFRTVNNFYGMELGLRGQRWHGRWLLEGTSLVALGDNQRLVYINGSTTVTSPGAPSATNPGGLLALGSNSGTFRSQSFMAIPQFSGRVGYRVTQRLTLLAGYTFIFWGGVATAGNQIDTTVNPNLLPPAVPGGPARPAYHLAESNFWAQGVTFGAQYNF